MPYSLDIREPIVDPSQTRIMLHAVPKWGKTTFFAGIPGAMFVLWEDGARAVAVRAWNVTTWEVFKQELWQFIQARDKGGPEAQVKLLCHDTVDLMASAMEAGHYDFIREGRTFE